METPHPQAGERTTGRIPAPAPCQVPHLVTASQMAAILKCSRDTLRRMRKAGSLAYGVYHTPTARGGGTLRYDVKQVLEQLEENRESFTKRALLATGRIRKGLGPIAACLEAGISLAGYQHWLNSLQAELTSKAGAAAVLTPVETRNRSIPAMAAIAAASTFRR
jgi:hypothetical protein